MLTFVLATGCSSRTPTKSDVALYVLEQREDYRTAWNVISEEMRHFNIRSKKIQCTDSAVHLKVLGSIAASDYVPREFR